MVSRRFLSPGQAHEPTAKTDRSKGTCKFDFYDNTMGPGKESKLLRYAKFAPLGSSDGVKLYEYAEKLRLLLVC